MKREALLQQLRQHLDAEREEHEIYARKIHETKNTVVRLLYEQLMNDSHQHANMLLAMIEFITSGKWESDEPVRETKPEFMRLMETEDRALRAYTQMMHDVNDLKMKALLNILALDEDRHYRLLQYVLEYYIAPTPKKGVEA